MSKNPVIGALCLVLGAGCGALGTWSLVSGSENAQGTEHEAQGTSRTHAQIVDRGEAATIAALRNRIAELEAQLAKKPEPERKVDPAAQAGADHPAPPQMKFRKDGRPDFKAMREEFRKNHPEEYARIEKAHAKREADRRARNAARAEYLSGVNTANWSEKAKKNHEDYLAALEERETLHDRMFSEDTSDEDREKLMRQERELRQTIRTLETTERQNLLSDAAVELGLDDDSAVSLVETVQDIYEATGSKGGGHEGPPPGGDAGGPGGGPGGPGGPGGGPAAP